MTLLETKESDGYHQCVGSHNERENMTQSQKMPHSDMKEDIVITGMAGRYPESDNIEEFAHNLYNNIDMVVEDERRWPYGFLGLPKGSGKLKDISRFDAKFFSVNDWEANYMDSQIRMMLEVTYEAIWDSGMDPNSLSGTNTGVFIGNCFDENTSAYAEDYTKIVGYKQSFAAMVANRYNLNGPSKIIDTACASSFSALHEALVSLRNNQCDRAIVAGVNLCLRAATQMQFYSLNMISPDGHCKCLDEDANGYAKGEALVIMILQKKSEAKRIYATLIHTKTNSDGFKDLGITYPSWELQRNLIRQTYSEAGIDPLTIKYCEAHCTGTQAGDPAEMRAICESMCIGRKDPLLIGALKSNIGHTEASSGLCSLTKVILSFENKSIPANLHMTKPNSRIEGLVSGVLKPITQNTPFDGEIVGLNCFGFGGVNVHVIVKSHNKKPANDNQQVCDHIPRLVQMCGRNQETLNHLFTSLLKNPQKLTRDYLSLINDISKTSPFKMNSALKGMKYRGFTVIENSLQNDSESIDLEIIKVPKDKKQIWYVFTGMGSQWPAMGKSLMNIESFAKSIRASAKVLNDYNIDLLSLLTENDENVMRCPLNSFITIAAIQIALVDLLNELDIRADGIIGHSIGELACAYADQCLTAEETILIAFWRGIYLQEYDKTKGMMAAVGMSWAEAQQRCPHNVFAACHNAEDSVTISGEENAIELFIEKLNDENIFARKVDSSGIAFHSPLINSIAEPLLEKLKTIIPSNRMRSSKWISSIYSQSECDSHEAKYVSPEYFVDNLILATHFYDAMKHVPKNAIIIEISPHHLLQPIIKRNMGLDITYIPLMKKNGNNLKLFLSSIGHLYTLGFNPTIEKLYPKVDYPVSSGTDLISPLIKWDHKKKYTVTQYPDFFNPIGRYDHVVKVDLQEKSDSYLTDHCVDGRVLFPATGYLMLAWKQLAKEYGVEYDKLPVEFENVSLHRATILPKTGITKFKVKVFKTSGNFVITESGSVAATGRVFVPEDEPITRFGLILEEDVSSESESIELRTKDIYKELRLRGYDYGPNFQCICKSNCFKNKLKASIKWNNNWITFADSMIQMAILGRTSRGLYLPVRIDSLRCDPTIFMANALELGEDAELDAVFDYHLNIGVSKGLEFRGIKANLAPRKLNGQVPIVEKFPFVPHNQICADEEEKYLLQYGMACDIQALKVVEKFKFSLEDFVTVNGNKTTLLEKSKDSNNIDENIENTSLYNLLIELNQREDVNTGEKSWKEEFISKLSSVDNDSLIEFFNNEPFLRSQLETVIENMQIIANKINVLEVNESSATMSSKIINWLTLSSFNMKINYSLLHPSVNELASDSLSNLQTHDWLIEKSKLPPEMNNLDLIIVKDSSICQLSSKGCINLTQLFESLWAALRENGFVLIACRDKISFAEEVICKVLDLSYFTSRKKHIIEEAQKAGFTLIGTKSNSFSSTALLLRKVSVDIQLNKQTFMRISDDFESWIEKLQNELKSAHLKPEGENIWLTADKPSNGIIGFVSCLRKEPNGDRIRCILNFDQYKEHGSDTYNQYLQTIIRQNLVMNVILDKKLGSFKHFTIESTIKPVAAEHCYLNVTTRGDLSSLKWFESQHKYWPLGRKDNEMLCYVYYAPLNFRDIMLATGKLPPDALPDDMGLQDCILGLEFSGRDENGNRVMGMIPSKGLATTLVMDDLDFLWPIPSNWSMEEASTIPVAYGTAYYALIIRGKLKPKESVLIHSGSGGVGQAAISIALSLNCQVFITVGSDAKREFLKNEFSKLSDHNFSSSRDTNFESHIKKETDGRGVDVILNSLSEEKLQASLRCLSINGRFLEIGKFDLSQNNDLSLSHLIRNKTFHGILLDTLLVKGPNSPSLISRHRKLIWDLMKEGIESGTVKPMKRTIFDIQKSEEAFRFMASGKHMGKVVIKIRDEEQHNVGSNSLKMLAIPRTVFKSNKSYIITGGLGGFGLELVNWMIERGADKFVLTSRTGPKEPYQHFRIKYFADIGVKVVISTKDASTLKGAEDLIEEASTLGPIGGIFHLSMVLSDGLFENQTIESFKKVCAPKSTTILNLDQISREVCDQIDYFVAFSSVSCGAGNPGQSNYGLANSLMERVCDLRRADGLHGFAIQWGAIGDVGYVIDNIRGNDVVICGSLPQRIPSCLASLDRLLQSDYSVCSSIIKVDFQFESNGNKANLLKSVAHILGVKDYQKIDLNTTLGELGMDSLMGVEVKQTLERDYDLVMSMQDIRKLSIAKIQEINAGNQSCVKSADSIQEKLLLTEESVIQIPTESIAYLNDIMNGDPVIFLPPVDGTYDLLKPIAKSLNRPAIGLNWTFDCKELKTTEETATHFLNVLKKALPNICTNYDIIGYSFGGVVGYEMGIQLQKKSKSFRKFILLDSSPPQFKSDTEEVVKYHKLCNEESGYIEALVSFLMNNVSIDYQKVKSLLQITPKEERTTKVSQIFLESAGIQCDPQTIAFAAESHSNKLFMLNTYSTENVKLNGNLLLLRANEHVVNEVHTNHIIKYDYGLNEIITGKCEVQVFTGDHKTFLTNNFNEVNNSINRYLNSD